MTLKRVFKTAWRQVIGLFFIMAMAMMAIAYFDIRFFRPELMISNDPFILLLMNIFMLLVVVAFFFTGFYLPYRGLTQEGRDNEAYKSLGWVEDAENFLRCIPFIGIYLHHFRPPTFLVRGRELARIIRVKELLASASADRSQ